MTAVAGETITLKGRNGKSEKVVVAAACENKTGGHWYCATHRYHAENNFDRHDGPGCKQVWICHEHGAEQP